MGNLWIGSVWQRGCGKSRLGMIRNGSRTRWKGTRNAGPTLYSRFPAGGEARASVVPMETVVEFIKRINAGNVDKLCELMSEDHVFQDALGKRFIGRETLRGGWKMYYEMVSDYKVRGEQFFVDKNVVAVFGTASGTSKRDGKFSSAGFWEIPAAWKAIVRDGRIGGGCVYAESSRA